MTTYHHQYDSGDDEDNNNNNNNHSDTYCEHEYFVDGEEKNHLKNTDTMCDDNYS